RFSRDWSSDVCSSDLRTLTSDAPLHALDAVVGDNGLSDGVPQLFRRKDLHPDNETILVLELDLSNRCVSMLDLVHLDDLCLRHGRPSIDVPVKLQPLSP